MATGIRYALITGCSAGGIGSALVESFQKRGLHVFATARDVSKMSHLASLPNVTLLSLDVASQSSIDACVEEVKVKTNGRLDFLVNNSGINFQSALLDINFEEARKVFDVNVWGVLATTNAFASLLVNAQGSVVIIGSVASRIHQPFMGIYSASKAAIEVIGDTLQIELSPLGVQVTVVMAGGVQTNIYATTPSYKPPPNSFYKPIEKPIAADTRMADRTKMEASVFANKVVDDALKGRVGLTWRGKMASVIRVLTFILPTFAMHKAVTQGSGLDQFPTRRLD